MHHSLLTVKLTSEIILFRLKFLLDLIFIRFYCLIFIIETFHIPKKIDINNRTNNNQQPYSNVSRCGWI